MRALNEALLVCIHNMCFHGEIRKILIRYLFLSEAMIRAIAMLACRVILHAFLSSIDFF